MSVLDRYVVGHYLRLLPLCVAAAAGVFVVVDFFLRVGELAEHGTSTGVVAAYFLFKLPRIVTEIFPAASLLAVLLGIGLLAERREVLAMQACGVRTARILVPLAAVGLITSLAILAWNETVVPPSSSRARAIQDIKIERKLEGGAFNANSLWFQNNEGYVNVEHYDAVSDILYGITLHEMDDRFRLRRLVEVPQAVWADDRWHFEGGSVTTFGPGAEAEIRAFADSDLEIDEKPADFRKKRRRSYEFSYGQLSRQVDRLRDKGLDATEYVVDLYFKLAAPFAGLVAVVLGLPLAVRGGKRGGGFVANIGLGLGVSFLYWSATALSISAGHAGTLPPLVAAWTPNALVALASAIFYLAWEV